MSTTNLTQTQIWSLQVFAHDGGQSFIIGDSTDVASSIRDAGLGRELCAKDFLEAQSELLGLGLIQRGGNQNKWLEISTEGCRVLGDNGHEA